jgi:acetate kinase
VRKYIGSYMAALGGVDAIVFTGGIGENAAPIRELTLKGMDSFGISVDPERNAKHQTDIGTGKVRILVIPTNEELAIGRDTAGILRTSSGAGTAAEPASEPRTGKSRS